MYRLFILILVTLSLLSCENTLTDNSPEPTSREILILTSENGVTVPSGEILLTDDSLLSIRATADENYHFLKWVQVGTDSLSITDTLNAFTTLSKLPPTGAAVKALFAPKSCTLIVNSSEHALSISHKDTLFEEYGHRFTLSVEPVPGYTFIQWRVSDLNSVDISYLTNKEVIVSVQGNGTITPVFESVTHTVKIDSCPNGVVTPAGTYLVTDSDSIAITATANEACRFVQWVQTGEEPLPIEDILSPTTFIRGVSADGSVKPLFEALQCTTMYSSAFLHKVDLTTAITDLYDNSGNYLNIYNGDPLQLVWQVNGYEMTSDFTVGSEGFSTLGDLLTFIMTELNESGGSVSVALKDGSVSISGTTDAVNLTLKNLLRPISNSYVSNTFLWTGPVSGTSAGSLLRPAQPADSLKNLRDRHGEYLGLELSDVIKINGIKNEVSIENSDNTYNETVVTLEDLTREISQTVLPESGDNLDVYINNEKNAFPKGAVIISAKPELLLQNLSVRAFNSNNNAVAPAAFNNTMNFTILYNNQ